HRDRLSRKTLPGNYPRYPSRQPAYYSRLLVFCLVLILLGYYGSHPQLSVMGNMRSAVTM
ncbi:unnamed protein product, partial [marine sediment metagenome]